MFYSLWAVYNRKQRAVLLFSFCKFRFFQFRFQLDFQFITLLSNFVQKFSSGRDTILSTVRVRHKSDSYWRQIRLNRENVAVLSESADL